jgi:hypothetical protein
VIFSLNFCLHSQFVTISGRLMHPYLFLETLNAKYEVIYSSKKSRGM